MILLLIFIIPLIVALLSALTRNARVSSLLTLVGTLTVFGLSAKVATDVTNSTSHLLTTLPGWIALDGLGALILLLVAFISLTASIFSIGYMDFPNSTGVRRYHINFNLFIFSMLIVPMIREPNIVWIAVELTTLFSVLLVGFENTHEALEAAWKYVVLTLMGAAVALLGFLVLYWAAHRAGVEHYTWSALTAAGPQSPVLIKSAFILILVGFGAKIGLVPLHTWLPDAHSQAPTPVCALLSGVETTVVLYVLLRLLPIVTAIPSIHANAWLITAGLISVGTAAFLLLRVRDYKRLFAFSTVEHMGIILTAIGIGSASAHLGGMTQIIGHTLTKAFCFYAAGSVLLLTGTRDIASVRGLIRKSPLAGVSLLFGGLAIAGAPPFILFLSEFSIIRAGLQSKAYLSTGLLIFFIAIAFFAIMNHISRMVFGHGTENDDKPFEPLPLTVKITLVLVAVPVIVLGLYMPAGLHKLIVLASTALGGL